MSYDTQKKIAGREPFTVLELDLDYCSLVYGVSPCTATGTGDDKCMNTRATCDDPDNYDKGTKTYKLCTELSGIPKGENLIPCIPYNKPPAFTSARINPGEGAGTRGSVTITLNDQTWSDRGIDPYVDDRTYDPMDRGTFWGKFIKRNPYYTGRVMRVKTGYIADPFSWSDFKTRTYIIEKIEGPNKAGQVVITGKDFLKLADAERAQIPVLSEGSLDADITDTATTLDLTPAGIGADYGSSGEITIGDEILSFSGRTSDQLTGLVRGIRNTTADAHEAGDQVQLAYTFESLNIVDFIYDALVNYAGIDGETYIPYDAGHAVPTGTPLAWDDEKADWLSGYNGSGCIPQPAGVMDKIRQAAAACNLDHWFDVVAAEFKIKANTPARFNATLPTLTDENHLIADSVSVKPRTDLRASQVWVWFDPINPLEKNDETNFTHADVHKDSEAEGPNKHDQKAVKSLFAWFFDASNAGEAGATSGRLLNRFSEIPDEVTFDLDAKDEDLEPGDLVNLATSALQDATGANLTTQMQIIEAREVVPGHRYRYKALTSRFNYLYGYIGPNTLLDYGSESDENRQKYLFIAPDTGIFSDGTPAYRII